VDEIRRIWRGKCEKVLTDCTKICFPRNIEQLNLTFLW
jgi:hypothetical protein